MPKHIVASIGACVLLVAAVSVQSATHVIGDVYCNGNPHCAPVRVVCEGSVYTGNSRNGRFDISFQCIPDPPVIQVTVGTETRTVPWSLLLVDTGDWYTCVPGYCPGPGCFLDGTQITMADGSTKPIEEIEVGDVVLGLDEASGEMKPTRVDRVFEPLEADSYLVINDRIRVTSTHPVMSGGAWLKTESLKVGDTLTDANGEPLLIQKMEIMVKPARVRTFSVAPYRSFVADGIIVQRKIPTEEEQPLP